MTGLEQLVERIRPLVPPFLLAKLAEFRTFERRYRWYRDQGYTHALAREKAWWQAGESP